MVVVEEVFRPADPDFLADPCPSYAVFRDDIPVAFDEAAGWSPGTPTARPSYGTAASAGSSRPASPPRASPPGTG